MSALRRAEKCDDIDAQGYPTYDEDEDRPAPVPRRTYLRELRRMRRRSLSERHFQDGTSYFIPQAKKKWAYWRKFDLESVARMTPDELRENNALVCSSCGDAFTKRSFSKSVFLFGCTCRVVCNMCMALVACDTLRIKVKKCPACSATRGVI